MSDSNSTHFSDNYRHLIYVICICKIKDTIDTSITHFLPKKNKGQKGGASTAARGIRSLDLQGVCKEQGHRAMLRNGD